MNVLPSTILRRSYGSIPSLTVPSPGYRYYIFLENGRLISFQITQTWHNTFCYICVHYNLVIHSILRNFPNLYTVTSILFLVYLVLYYNVLSPDLYCVTCV